MGLWRVFLSVEGVLFCRIYFLQMTVLFFVKPPLRIETLYSMF